jgi:hypothetical protein
MIMDVELSKSAIPASGAAAERFGQGAGVVLRHVAGEHMLVPTVSREVDLDSLFLLNATGVFIWEQLDGQRTVEELSQSLAVECGVDKVVATADVTRFLASLLERHLAERTPVDEC